MKLDLNSIFNGALGSLLALAIGYLVFFSVSYIKGHPVVLDTVLNTFVTVGIVIIIWSIMIKANPR